MVGVVTKDHEAFLTDCGLLAPTEGRLFAYFSWDSEPQTECFLSALSANHKLLLWQVFLEDHQQPREFDWLWETYYAEGAHYLLEWELALRTVMEKLQFQVERSENSYRLLDFTGRERCFDFIKGGAAEKVFLKLLFPVDLR